VEAVVVTSLIKKANDVLKSRLLKLKLIY